MMIELVLSVCLLAAPTECRKERLSFDGPFIACVMSGQIDAAAWVAARPKWRVVRWSCGYPERRA